VALARAATLAEGSLDGRDNVAGHVKLFARSPTGGALLCLKLEQVYQRYLLATDTKAGVYLYDCALPEGRRRDTQRLQQ